LNEINFKVKDKFNATTSELENYQGFMQI